MEVIRRCTRELQEDIDAGRPSLALQTAMDFAELLEKAILGRAEEGIGGDYRYFVSGDNLYHGSLQEVSRKSKYAILSFADAGDETHFKIQLKIEWYKSASRMESGDRPYAVFSLHFLDRGVCEYSWGGALKRAMHKAARDGASW